MKRKVFKNTSDILDFEFDLIIDSMTDEELERFELPAKNRERYDINDENLPIEIKNKIQKIQKYTSDNYYFDIKSGKYILIEDKNDAQELIDKHEIITYADYIRSEINKKYPFNNKKKVIGNLDPIIFQNKGKTPPSVPYLQVMIATDVEGDIKALHQIHSKTR